MTSDEPQSDSPSQVRAASLRNDRRRSDHRRLGIVLWHVAGVLIVLFVALGLRYGTEITNLDHVREEVFLHGPITNILEQGWSRQTMFDFQRIRGPVFYWLYAAGGTLIGGEVNDLRRITVMFFVLTVIPLLLIVQRCNASGRMILVVAVLYALAPYNAFVGQLLMSEPSFIFFGMWLLWVFMWGFGTAPDTERRFLGPLLFGILLAILLHHSLHAVALAGAAAWISFERDGLGCWPWWVACLLAGLSRLPLYWYWSGTMSGDFESVFGFGFRPECAAYLFAAILPVTWVFLWPVLRDPILRGRWAWLASVSVFALLAAVIFPPDLTSTIQYTHPLTGETASQAEYAGMIKTGLRMLALPGALEYLALIALAMLGGASIGALLVLTSERNITDEDGVVWRMAFMTLLVGMPVYVLTTSPVYDRFLQVWIILMPVLWLWSLPRPLLAVKVLFLIVLMGYLADRWLL